MKSREADVLIPEEKVSRMTNELNVAIREKGVAKMQLEEITAESLLAEDYLSEKRGEERGDDVETRASGESDFNVAKARGRSRGENCGDEETRGEV